VGTNARFNFAYDIAIDQQTGSLFVSDIYNHTIRKITPQGKSFHVFSLIFVVIEYFDQEKCQQLLELEKKDLQMVL
jgi:hypothetical protein